MIAPNLSLSDYVEKFLADRDVSAVYRFQVRDRCKKLAVFAGGELRVDQVSCELVNAWLAHVKESGLSAYTVHTYRANVLAVWNEAYADGLNNSPPLRVRKIKRPRLLVKAYNHAEINLLLAAVAKRHGKDTYGNNRADVWRKIIHAAYSTGLRRGDLLLVFEADIQPDGTYRTIQHKTGEPVTVRFSPESLAIKLHCPNGLLIPWPYRHDALAWSFRRLRKMAGVTRGSLKWLRRSAGSYADREEPGSGGRALGQTSERTFRTFYRDGEIAGDQPVSPPPLS